MARYIELDGFIRLLKLIYCKSCDSWNGLKCQDCQTKDIIQIMEQTETIHIIPDAKYCPWCGSEIAEERKDNE